MSEQFPAHLAAAIKDRIAVLRQAWDDDGRRQLPAAACRGTRRPEPHSEEPGAFPMSQTLSLPVTAAGRQQHDLYDLPLSTTPSAAEQFRDAQARLLRVQTGVAAPLQRAVALDPRVRPRPRRPRDGRARPRPVDRHGGAPAGRPELGGPGHRPRAQLRRRRVGADPGRRRAPVPVAAAPGRAPARRARAEHGRPDHRLLRRGRGARAGLGAGRGRASGVRLGLVVRRAAGLRPAGAGPLRRGRRPRPAARWRPSPRPGTRPTRMAHVFYETGRHGDGLRWIDDWIGDNRATTFQPSHYSWHAALHELALGDETAVRRRYISELAPSSVQGVRALIDSASLLWRARIADSWHGELPIDDVLSVVDEQLLVTPPTPFVGMHAAVALAAREDGVGLQLLGRHAAVDPRPEHRDLVAPFAAAMSALVDGRPDRAAGLLLRADAGRRPVRRQQGAARGGGADPALRPGRGPADAGGGQAGAAHAGPAEAVARRRGGGPQCTAGPCQLPGAAGPLAAPATPDLARRRTTARQGRRPPRPSGRRSRTGSARSRAAARRRRPRCRSRSGRTR